MPRRLEKLRKSGMKKLSRTDADARFLRERSGFALGYTAEAAVNEDHLIVGQRVTQNAADNSSLIPMVEEAERQSGATAGKDFGRCRIFLAGKYRGTGRPGPGGVLAGFESGAGVEHGAALRAHPAQPDAAAHATEIARADRTSGLSATQGLSRTGLGNAKRTTRDEAVSVAGIGKSKHRVHPGCHLVQPDPAAGQPPVGPKKFSTTVGKVTAMQRVLTRSLKPGSLLLELLRRG